MQNTELRTQSAEAKALTDWGPSLLMQIETAEMQDRAREVETRRLCQRMVGIAPKEVRTVAEACTEIRRLRERLSAAESRCVVLQEALRRATQRADLAEVALKMRRRGGNADTAFTARSAGSGTASKDAKDGMDDERRV